MHRYLLLPLLLLSGAAAARTLSVGPNQPFLFLSAAAHAAQDGDTVLIEPGEYYDCAVWTQNHLVIAGARPGGRCDHGYDLPGKSSVCGNG
jgi:hypothetical protein